MSGGNDGGNPRGFAPSPRGRNRHARELARARAQPSGEGDAGYQTSTTCIPWAWLGRM
jgi:hypothetical protein